MVPYLINLSISHLFYLLTEIVLKLQIVFKKKVRNNFLISNKEFFDTLDINLHAKIIIETSNRYLAI